MLQLLTAAYGTTSDLAQCLLSVCYQALSGLRPKFLDGLSFSRIKLFYESVPGAGGLSASRQVLAAPRKNIMEGWLAGDTFRSVSAGLGFQKGKPPVLGEDAFSCAGQGLPTRATL